MESLYIQYILTIHLKNIVKKLRSIVMLLIVPLLNHAKKPCIYYDGITEVNMYWSLLGFVLDFYRYFSFIINIYQNIFLNIYILYYFFTARKELRVSNTANTANSFLWFKWDGLMTVWTVSCVK